MSEMFALATAFSLERLPEGNRIGILTNAGGAGDHGERWPPGLEVVELSPGRRSGFRPVLVAEASVRNPVDSGGRRRRAELPAALAILKDDPGLTVCRHLRLADHDHAVEVAAAIIHAAGTRGADPTCFNGKEQGKQGVEELRDAGIPVYMFPEEAARAMAGLDRYRRMRARPEGSRRTFDGSTTPGPRPSCAAPRPPAARSCCRGDGAAVPGLRAPLAPSRIVTDETQAVAAAAELGLPGRVKGGADNLVHKTEAGAVRLDLRSRPRSKKAFREMRQSLRSADLRYQSRRWCAGAARRSWACARSEAGRHPDVRPGGIVFGGAEGRGVPHPAINDPFPRRRAKMVPDPGATRCSPGARRIAVDEAFLVEALLRLAQMADERPRSSRWTSISVLAERTARRRAPVDARVRLVAR